MFISNTNGPIFHYYGDDATKTIEHLAKCGYKKVDISFYSRFFKGSQYFGEDYLKVADEYNEVFAKYNIQPVQSHEPVSNVFLADQYDEYIFELTRSLEIASRIGVPSMTIHPGMPKESLTRDEYIERSIACTKKLMPLAEKYNMLFLYENIGCTDPFDGIYAITAQDLIDVVDEVNHPLLAVNWDIGHGNCNHLNQYDEITKLGSRLKGVHIHDNKGFGHGEAFGEKIWGDFHMMPFYGTVNYDDMMKALLEINYPGALNFECDAPARIPEFAKGNPALLEEARLYRECADTALYHIGKMLLKKYDCLDE